MRFHFAALADATGFVATNEQNEPGESFPGLPRKRKGKKKKKKIQPRTHGSYRWPSIVPRRPTRYCGPPVDTGLSSRSRRSGHVTTLRAPRRECRRRSARVAAGREEHSSLVFVEAAVGRDGGQRRTATPAASRVSECLTKGGGGEGGSRHVSVIVRAVT